MRETYQIELNWGNMNTLKTEHNTVYFPKTLNHQSVAEMCQRIEHICKTRPKNRNIFFDAKNFSSINALALTVLFNEIAYVKSLGWNTYISNHFNEERELKRAIQNMDDCEFFLLMSGNKLNSQSKCPPTSLPIKRLAPAETIAWLYYEAMPWLARRLNTTADDLVEIRICLEELLNNIRDHSDVEFSSIFIEHQPKLNRLTVCISDNGIGLVNRIKTVHPEFSAKQAVEFALSEGGTTKSSPRNAGMGLFTLTQTVCNNGGTFRLRTGEIDATFTNSSSGSDNVHYLDNPPFLKGTAFEITLYADKLDTQQTNLEVFSWD